MFVKTCMWFQMAGVLPWCWEFLCHILLLCHKTSDIMHVCVLHIRSLEFCNVKLYKPVYNTHPNFLLKWCAICDDKHSSDSQQHTYMSSSYRSNRLGLSHWDPYAMRRGSGLKLYYCNVVKRWLTYTVCGLSVAMGTVINWWADVVWQASVCQHTFLLLWNYTDVLFPNPTGAGFCQISNANFARARFSP